MRLLLFFLLPVLASAQVDSTAVVDTLRPLYVVKEKPKRAQKKLVLSGAAVEGDLVAIRVEAPYTGVLEFSLRDADDRLTFFNQYICRIGGNTIRLRRDAFQKSGPGTYTYTIRYKEENYTDRFTIP